MSDSRRFLSALGRVGAWCGNWAGRSHCQVHLCVVGWEETRGRCTQRRSQGRGKGSGEGSLFEKPGYDIDRDIDDYSSWDSGRICKNLSGSQRALRLLVTFRNRVRRSYLQTKVCRLLVRVCVHVSARVRARVLFYLLPPPPVLCDSQDLDLELRYFSPIHLCLT